MNIFFEVTALWPVTAPSHTQNHTYNTTMSQQDVTACVDDLVTRVISNAAGAGAATQVTSALSNDLSSTAFTILSNNTPPVVLAAGESVTNTYELIALERGN